jgi:hypothetical protein
MNYRVKDEYNEFHPSILIILFLSLKDYWFTDRNNTLFERRNEVKNFLTDVMNNKNAIEKYDDCFIIIKNKFDEFMEQFESTKINKGE